MIDIKDRAQSLTDRATWAGRRASFMAKVKATKVVWFPPTPAKSGQEATATAKKASKTASKTAAKKTTATAKKTTATAKKVVPGADK